MFLRLHFFIILFFYSFVVFSSSSWNIKQHLSTKTMYSPKYNQSIAPTQCEPVQVNLVARHGARFPGKSDISEYTTLSDKMAQYANYYLPEYQWMATWENPYTTKEADILTYSGQVEHYNLAQRMLSRYSQVMGKPYEPYTYVMQSTQKSRAGRSGISFGYSLFQNQSDGIFPYPSKQSGGGFAPFFIDSDSLDQDVHLRFFDVCPTYVNTVDENPSAEEQANIYYDNQVANAGIQLSQLIGVYPAWNISSDEISLMYKGCGYDIAVSNITNNFCSLFPQDIGSVLEYYNNLSSYYIKGYGHPVNYEIACLLLKDIFQVHDDYISGENTDLLAKYRFAHAETIMPLISILGFYKDSSPLMANWDETQQENRKWKTSEISPFAANVQFILYYCGNNEYKIKILVNEIEQIIPGCDSVYCDYNQVTQIYFESLTCNYYDICYNSETLCEYYCN